MKTNTSNNGQEEKVILTLTELNRTLTLARKQGRLSGYTDGHIAGFNLAMKEVRQKTLADVGKIIKEYPLYDDVLIRTSEIKRGLKQEIAKLNHSPLSNGNSQQTQRTVVSRDGGDNSSLSLQDKTADALRGKESK